MTRFAASLSRCVSKKRAIVGGVFLSAMLTVTSQASAVPTTVDLDFDIGTNGVAQFTVSLDDSGRRCRLKLFGASQSGDGGETRRLQRVATRRFRGNRTTIRLTARNLPAVTNVDGSGEIPVFNALAQVTCRGAVNVVSEPVARFIRCGVGPGRSGASRRNVLMRQWVRFLRAALA